VSLRYRVYRSRNGSLFGTGTIHEILTRRAYTGVRNFNEFARKGDGERKAQSEIVEYEIPVAIDRFTRWMREQLVSGDVAAQGLPRRHRCQRQHHPHHRLE
jgi:hypothetical protein